MKQIDNGLKLIYDIEVYPNLFLVAFFNIDNNNYETFVLLNDNTYQDYHSISELVDFIQDDNKTLIGFNNSEYDDLLLKYINENPNSTNQELYEISKSIIEKNSDKNSYYNLKYKTNKSWNKSIDLYKILPNGYGSLKELSIKLHHHKTQDLPYPPDKTISYKEADEIIRYNINDIEITRKIYQLDETKQIITIRSNMEKDYGVDALSSADSNLGDRIFLKKYCESTNQNEYDVKEQQTDVSMVVLKDDIPDYISFETKELQSLLVELQEMGITVDKKTGKINDNPLKRTVKFHNMNYKFSGGGLHSIDKPEIFESDDEYCIIDADVTSYYPYIIINNGIKPNHLQSVFLDIYKRLVDERIQAKKSGNKIKADGLKITINSIYGKFKARKSWLYDVKAQLSVSIIGQLSLLMLIEKLVTNGINVISANTDGIIAYVKRDRVNDFMKLCIDWESITRYSLDYTQYKRYIRKDINNYLCVKDNGEIKKKGIFDDSLNKKGSAIIIRKAIERFFVDNVNPDDTIRNCKNIHDFLYYFKANKDYQMKQGDRILQNINRWYISTSKGETIYKTKDDSKNKIADSYNAKIVNDIDDNSIPLNLDYGHYIKESKKIIDIINSKSTDKRVYKTEYKVDIDNELIKIVNYLNSLNLFPIPKWFGKYNPKDSKLSEIKTDWDYEKFDSLGVYTGIKANTIVIDIDNPELAKEKKIYELLDSGLIIHHSSYNTLKELIDNNIRFKVIYKCDNYNLKSLNLISQYGLEIIYGGKTATVYGTHPTTQEQYKIFGEINDLPYQLEEWIINELPKLLTKRKLRKKDKYNKLVDEQELFKILIQSVKEVLPNWDFNIDNNEDKRILNNRKLVGRCLFEDSHTTKSNVSNFNIYIDSFNGVVVCNCFHESCKNEISELRKKINDVFEDKLNDEIYKIRLSKLILREEGLNTSEYRDIKSSFDEDSKYKLIIAPTGSGKTYQSVFKVIEWIRKEIPFLFVANRKADMEQFIDRLKKVLDTDKLSDFRIVELLSGKELGKIDKVNGVITHHTYIKRKGIDDLMFNLANFIIEREPAVIIDEGDNFLAGLIYLIFLLARYKKHFNADSNCAVNVKQDKCPVFNRSGNCQNCHLGNNAEYYHNTYNIAEFTQSNRVIEGNFNKPSVNIDLNIFKKGESKIILDRCVEITPIENKIDINDDELEADINHLHEEGIKIDINTSLKHMLKYALNPMIYRTFPVFTSQSDNEIIYINEISPDEITKDNRKYIKFPSSPCNVKVLLMNDSLPLRLLKKYSRELIILSATITPNNKKFLEDVIPEMKTYHINIKNPRIDELLIIGYEKPIPFVSKNTSIIDERLTKNGKVLIFKPTHNDAKKLYDKLKKVKPKTALFKKDGLEADVTYDEYWDTVITHSRGNIGRGIDLPEYDTVIVDASIYLPFLALNLKLEEMTEENILLALDNDRFMIAIQNMGRILRVKEDDKDKISRKCIIIEGISNDDLKLLLEISNLQSMIKNKIQTIHYKNNPQNIFESAKEYLEKGEVVNIKEISPVDKAVNEGLSSICKSDREKYKLEIEEAKREKKLKEIKDDIKSLKETGMCWSKIARKLNLYKLIKRYNLDLEDLKSYYRSI